MSINSEILRSVVALLQPRTDMQPEDSTFSKQEIGGYVSRNGVSKDSMDIDFDDSFNWLVQKGYIAESPQGVFSITEIGFESEPGDFDRFKSQTRLTDGSDLPTDFINDRQPRDSDPPYPGRVVEPHDSTAWTGSQFVLVDAKVIVKIKAVALELQAAAYALNFRSEADRDDIQGLVDALVAITRMAEPEVNVIQRILASPKFKTYTSLFGIIATFRGAVGI